MKIRLSDIPHHGLKVQDILPLEALHERMASGRGQDIRFLTPPKVTLLITKSLTGALVEGSINAHLSQDCARCSDPLKREHHVTIATALQNRESGFNEDAAIEPPEEDIGVLYYEGEHVDLEPHLQDCLILSLNLYWAPDCDKSGNCCLCFKPPPELNPTASSGTSLASLLKKAGLKG
jgi:uncharacterized metal-binding protein YceD (DUF177 family)